MSIEDAEIELGEQEFKDLLRLKIIQQNEDGYLIIKFLDEQYEECVDISKIRSKAAKARWSKANEMQMDASALQSNADKNRQEEKEQKRQEQTENVPLPLETNFDIFWKAYDYNVGMRQTMAEWSSIEKEMPTEIAKILVHVPKYVASKPDKGYRKRPDNYLKDRSWNDEIVKPKQSQTQPVIDKFIPRPPQYPT
jgi:hypothetical protein